MPIELRELGTESFLYMQGATGCAAFGSDGTDGEKIKLVTGLGVTDLDPASGNPQTLGSIALTIDPSVNGDIILSPKGIGETQLFNGSLNIQGNDATVTPGLGDGNLIMSNTSTTGRSGVIELGGEATAFRFIHNYGDHNTFVGKLAGNFSMTGTKNTAVGTSALTAETSGFSNTAVGSTAMALKVAGNYNAAFGDEALALMTSGNNNTAIGTGAMGAALTGSFNTTIGTAAGGFFIGSESSNICVGNFGGIGDNNTIRIGQPGSSDYQQNKCFIAGIVGSSITSTGVVTASATGQLSSTNGSSGQLLIGGGTGPVWANITSSGATITVTNGANTINLETAAPGTTWSVITADQTAAVNNGYICNKGSALLLALPTTSAAGTVLEVTGINTALGWKITQAAGQQIFFGTSSTTSGATGFLQSSAIRDSVKMVCVVANLTWNVISSVGNITVS